MSSSSPRSAIRQSGCAGRIKKSGGCRRLLRHALLIHAGEIDRDRASRAGIRPAVSPLPRIWRAKGNSMRGHSIRTAGCSILGGKFSSRNNPAYFISAAKMVLPCDCALASSCNSTSKSVGARLRALTLTPMLISGCRGLRGERLRRARILEAQILEILRKNAHRGLVRRAACPRLLRSLRPALRLRQFEFFAFRLVGRTAIR